MTDKNKNVKSDSNNLKNIKNDAKTTHINITAENRYVYESRPTIAYLYDENNNPIAYQDVTLTFDDDYGTISCITDDRGMFQDVLYTNRIPKTVTVTANYDGNTTLGYGPCSKSITFEVTKYGQLITIEASEAIATMDTQVNLTNDYQGSSIDANVKVNDSLGNVLFNKTITFIDQKANFTFTALTDKDITINVSIVNHTFVGNVSKAVTISSSLMPTTTNITAPASVVVGEDIPVVVTIKDKNNKVVSEGTARVLLNNKDVLDFDAKMTTVNCPTTKKEEVPLKVEYDGLENVYAASTSNEVLINIQAYNTAMDITSDNNITAHRNATATVKLTSGTDILKNEDVQIAVKQANENLEFTQVVNDDGTITVTYMPVSNSSVNITAVYAGGDMYNPSNKSIVKSVSNMPTKLDVQTANVEVNDTLKINITLKDADNNSLSDKVLTAKVNGVNKDVIELSNGNYYVEYKSNKALTDVSIKVDFKSFNAYDSSSITSDKFNVTKIPTTVDINIDNYTVNNFTATITVNSIKGIVNEGSILLYADDEVIGKANLSNSSVTITNTTMAYGNYTLKAEYTGVDVFNNSKKTTPVSTELISTTLKLDIDNKNLSINDTVTVIATLTDGKLPITAQTVQFIFNDSTVLTAKTDDSGVAQVKYTKTDEYKKVSVYAEFNQTSLYNKQNTSTDYFIVNKLNTDTTVSILSDMVDNVTIAVKVTSNNKAVQSGNLEVSVDNKKFTQKVTQAQTIIPLNITKSGKTPVSVQFVEDKQYLSSKATDSNNQLFDSIDVKKQSSKITLSVNNSTVDVDSPVTISGNLSYANNKRIANAPVTLNVSGQIIKTTTDNNGIYSVKYTPIKEVQYNITAVYAGNTTNITDATEKAVFMANKIKTTTSIKVLNNTVVNTTLSIGVKDAYKNTVTDGVINLTVNNKNQIIAVKDALSVKIDTTTNESLQITATYNGTDKYSQSATTKTVNIVKTNVIIKLDKITPVKINQTYTVKLNVVDLNNQPIKEGTVTLYNNNSQIAKIKLTNGTITASNLSKYSGNYNITAKFADSAKYNDASNSTVLTVNKLNTTITIDNVNVVIGDEATFKVHVTDENNNKVHGGKVVLKLNGVSLTDDNDKLIQQPVINGIATVKYTVPLNWAKSDYNISAVYGGTTNTFQSSRSTNYKLKTSYRTAKIDLTITPKTNKMDKVSTLTVKVTDNNKAVNAGVVIFKINGQTIKDKNQKSVIVNVVNGVASYNYTLPDGLKAADYNITAVYSNKNYNRAEVNQTLTALRADVHFNVTVTCKNRVVSVKGKLLDEYDHVAIGTSTLAVKLNGISVKTNNTSTFSAVNGVINFNFTIPSAYKASEYQLQLVSGQRYAYNAQKYTKTIKVE